MSSSINHSGPVNQNCYSDLYLFKVTSFVIRSAGLSEVFTYLNTKLNPSSCNFSNLTQISFKRFRVSKHFVLSFSDKIHNNTIFKMLGIHFTARKTDNNSREGKVLFIKGATLALENTKLADLRWKM